jgi:hypothetical protein
MFESDPQTKMRYFLDLRERFKGADIVEVKPLHWFIDGNSQPQIVVAVINTHSEVPGIGETMVASVGRTLKAVPADRFHYAQEVLSRRIESAQRANDADKEKVLLDQSARVDLGALKW